MVSKLQLNSKLREQFGIYTELSPNKVINWILTINQGHTQWIIQKERKKNLNSTQYQLKNSYGNLKGAFNQAKFQVIKVT